VIPLHTYNITYRLVIASARNKKFKIYFYSAILSTDLRLFPQLALDNNLKRLVIGATEGGGDAFGGGLNASIAT
jgi:hypothetical protein